MCTNRRKTIKNIHTCIYVSIWKNNPSLLYYVSKFYVSIFSDSSELFCEENEVSSLRRRKRNLFISFLMSEGFYNVWDNFFQEISCWTHTSPQFIWELIQYRIKVLCSTQSQFFFVTFHSTFISFSRPTYLNKTGSTAFVVTTPSGFILKIKKTAKNTVTERDFVWN